jgi:hypothetical protein
MENVFETAVKFIEKSKESNPKLWNNLKMIGSSRDAYNVFWWNDEVRLYDIPLENKKTKERSGYILVSESRDLPPILEYSTEGNSLKQQVDEFLIPALAISDIDASPLKYHFINSLELYVTVEDHATDSSFMVNIPNLYTIKDDLKTSLHRIPSEVYNPAKVKDYWSELEDDARESPNTELVLTNRKPVMYQQNCESYSLRELCKLDTSTSNSPCNPKAISGCAPVAWAMLLSSWKKINMTGTDQIWKGSSTWSTNWPSYMTPTNPSQSAEVEQTIWKVHEILGTDDNGGTVNTKIPDGEKIMETFNLSWNFHRSTSGSFSFAKELIGQAGQPFIFDGYGTWSREKAGHAVVVYGYRDLGEKLYVSRGWGKSFTDIWISNANYSNKGYTYRVTDEEDKNPPVYKIK